MKKDKNRTIEIIVSLRMRVNRFERIKLRRFLFTDGTLFVGDIRDII